LRSVLAGYLGIPAEQVVLGLTATGKPFLEGHAGPAFNLSHSGSVLVIAVSARESVGVDIEQLRGRSHEGLFERALGRKEAEVVRACAPAARERAFLRHWTAKEACLKAWGTGLRGDLRALRIGDALERPAVVGDTWSQEEGDTSIPLELQHYDPSPDLVGTVAAGGGPWRAVPLRLDAGDYLG